MDKNKPNNTKQETMSGHRLPLWRRIIFIEALITFIIFSLISAYVLWRTMPLEVYCPTPDQCIDLPSFVEKLKLAMGAGTLFLYSFAGPLVVLFAIPFIVSWFIKRFIKKSS